MSIDVDVIIIGSGPAGVSAAFPLLAAGLRVLMLDGGQRASVNSPAVPFLEARASDPAQARWMIGDDFHALRNSQAISPKLRVPTHDYVFKDFAAVNRIRTSNFVAVGSLAVGGLSNAWGCGVARWSGHELAAFPFAPEQLDLAYERVTRRMGVSGAAADDLAGYFGLDPWIQPALPMDHLHRRLAERYATLPAGLANLGFRLGRSRVAALSQDQGARRACDLSGNCLYGCAKGALYSAAGDLPLLSAYPHFYYRSGTVAESLVACDGGVQVHGRDGEQRLTLRAAKVFLAAGTLASTGLALRALQSDFIVPVQSSPTAAFLLWQPASLGASRQPGFGLGQLSFSLALNPEVEGFGSTFNTNGIPVSEFVGHMPLHRRFAIPVLRSLLSSCLVGNIFLPGSLSSASARLKQDGTLHLEGGYRPEVVPLMRVAEQRLRAAYWKLGALLLPKSFKLGPSGGDIHYAGTLPMRHDPERGQTDASGQLEGLRNVYVVDGASLPTLSAKSHTLTIMANADRIGTAVAATWGERTMGSDLSR